MHAVSVNDALALHGKKEAPKNVQEMLLINTSLQLLLNTYLICMIDMQCSSVCDTYNI